jgi:hypothetical protein
MLFLNIFGCQYTKSMAPDDFIINCPVCSKKYWIDFSIKGLNKRCGKWSDGFKEGDIVFYGQLLMRCDECFGYSWTEVDTPGRNEIGNITESFSIEKLSENETIKELRPLNPDEYAEAIALRCYNSPEVEQVLRKRLWWKINDPIRIGKQKWIDPKWKTLFEENLESLIYRMQRNEQKNLLMLAEIHRELGLFAKAGNYLDLIKTASGKADVSEMRARISERDPLVFCYAEFSGRFQ